MNIEQFLKDHGLRTTDARKTLFNVLTTCQRPLFIHEIIDQSPDTDRVSIYRNIELFQRLGILEIINVGWKKQYELSSIFKPHHHHLYCSSCHTITDIDSQSLESFVVAITEQHAFTPASHTFEITGICKDCAPIC